MRWEMAEYVGGRRYVCAFCDSKVASGAGYRAWDDNPSRANNRVVSSIYICPDCANPTYFTNSTQVPAPYFGNLVESMPEDMETLYKEARECISIRAYTAAVMLCRKLLMHIAVEKGDGEDKSFKEYVEYLDTNHYLPPGSKELAEQIRKQGNEANHKLESKTEEDAKQLIRFVEMLARFIYEIQSLLNEPETETKENQGGFGPALS